jgi:hypothetical protein
MDGCRVGQYSLSDPDGIVLDLSDEKHHIQPSPAKLQPN